MRHVFKALTLIALAAGSMGVTGTARSDTVTMTFDRVTLVDNGYTYRDAPYQENGLVIQVPQATVNPDCNARALTFQGTTYSSYTGSPAAIFFGSCDDYDLELTRIDGGAFDFVSVDLMCCDGSNGMEDYQVNFVAVYADGSQRVITVYPVTTSLATYQINAANIVALRWKGGFLNLAIFPIYDNFVVSTGSTVLSPWIEVTPQSVDFGPVVIAGENTLRVTVRNIGTAPLNVGSIGVTDPLAQPFSLKQDQCKGMTLSPGKTCAFTLAFAPLGVGEYRDALNVVSNDPYSPSTRVDVRGIAVTVGGQTLGLRQLSVTCENKARKSKVTFPVSADENWAWDCQVAGLPVKSGDQITMTINGLAE